MNNFQERVKIYPIETLLESLVGLVTCLSIQTEIVRNIRIETGDINAY